MQRTRRLLILYAVFAFVFWTALLGGDASGMTGHSAFVFNYRNGSGFRTGLTVDGSGNIWGISPEGGAYGGGNVFELTRNTAGQLIETVLYNFTGGRDGGAPTDDDGPLIDSVGNLYGTTSGGGTYNGGTVFKLTHGSNGWEESVMWNFTCGNDGCWPAAGLASDSVGNLYGTTYAGGPGGLGYGTVFELSPDGRGNWKEKTLHIFSGGTDGAGPYATLALDQSGNIYGTTTAGGFLNSNCNFAGYYGCGVIFQLTQGVGGVWDEQVLYTFMGANDGANPYGKLAFDVSGNIYGVSALFGDPHCGCGTVFRLAPPTSSGGQWDLSTMHTFIGESDGAYPSEGVIVDKTGIVYGTAVGGGRGQCFVRYSSGCGTFYRLAPNLQGNWNFELLYSFLGKTDGGGPWKIVFAGSTAYIPTSQGGSSGTYFCTGYGCGTIFQLSMTSQ